MARHSNTETDALLILPDNALFPAEFANLLYSSADLLAATAHPEQMLTDYSSGNAHDLGYLFLGFLVQKIGCFPPMLRGI